MSDMYDPEDDFVSYEDHMPKPVIVEKPSLMNDDQYKCVQLLEEYIDSGHFSEFESTFMQTMVNKKDLGPTFCYLTTRQHRTLNGIINKFRDRGII